MSLGYILEENEIKRRVPQDFFASDEFVSKLKQILSPYVDNIPKGLTLEKLRDDLIYLSVNSCHDRTGIENDYIITVEDLFMVVLYDEVYTSLFGKFWIYDVYLDGEYFKSIDFAQLNLNVHSRLESKIRKAKAFVCFNFNGYSAHTVDEFLSKLKNSSLKISSEGEKLYDELTNWYPKTSAK